MNHDHVDSYNGGNQIVIFETHETKDVPTYKISHCPSIYSSPERLKTIYPSEAFTFYESVFVVSSNPIATPSKVMQCASENKRPKKCGTKGELNFLPWPSVSCTSVLETFQIHDTFKNINMKLQHKENLQ